MAEGFDKELLFENINYLVKSSAEKIGTIEEKSGVSAGYIARCSKNDGPKPSIDFLVKLASVLNVSIDTLLHAHLAELSPTEKYLMGFFEKLKRDTIDSKLEWKRESADMLTRIVPDRHGLCDHPLFTFERFSEYDKDGHLEDIAKCVFVSHSYDCHTTITGDCFNLRLKNGTYLYLMTIRKGIYSPSNSSIRTKEAWMVSKSGTKQFLCDDSGKIGDILNELYELVKEDSKCPKIESDIKNAIDAFMQDDIEDDNTDDDIAADVTYVDPDEIPF